MIDSVIAALHLIGVHEIYVVIVFSESSMNNIQSVSIISAFSIGIIMIIMIWSVIKDSKQYMDEMVGK